ncbi:hypothetical protein Drose_06675 [Dactylosporangium roseum]|uniref:Uncharacterized protein n=1 Tax=Dactylosporangium roseum TaxID=47989 RepID=A0ABY5Z8H2_9ACTN|nr:hypothetical protein [Dactylosporangium roseum]UWZ37954.1 hypothetical protein Drose_06675 [Dactylosporangium roseum]
MLWESSRSVDIRQSTAIGLSQLFGVKVGWGSTPNFNFLCLRETRQFISENTEMNCVVIGVSAARDLAVTIPVESMPRLGGGVKP